MTNRGMIYIAIFVMVLALVGMLYANRKPQPPAGLSGLTEVSFATDWKAQAEHGGFYQAVALGLYEKRGLKVTIRQGGPGINIPQLMAAGAIDYGMGSNSFIPLNMVEAARR